MTFDRQDLKRQAKEAMGEARPKFWVVTLVFFLLTTVVQWPFQALASILPDSFPGYATLSIFFSILYSLYTMVIQFGYHLWSLWTWRKLGPDLGSLFQGFSIFGRLLLMEVLIFLRILGWSFVLGFVMLFTSFLIFSPFLFIPYIIALYILFYVLLLRYAMAPYLLADYPDDGASSAIRRSVEMMDGWKWELFKLEFSFFGWYLIQTALSAVVLLLFFSQTGLFEVILTLDTMELTFYQQIIWPATLVASLVTLPLSLWLTPYTEVTMAGFYDLLSHGAQRSDQAEMPPL